MVLFGKPKSGKSSIVASLDNNLVIDLEDGYRALEVMLLQAKTATDLFAIKNKIQSEITTTGKQPYRFITIDNATRLEEMALPYAAVKYRKTQMGKDWGLKRDKEGNLMFDANNKVVIDQKADVRQLPNGAGYLYLREALKEIVYMFIPLCETLILICHVKDKQIRINGEEQSEMAVDLCGKMADIICGEADAIGYVYRESNKTYISFEGGSNTIREARCLHLRGKKIKVAESDENNNLSIDMSEIFIDNGTSTKDKNTIATTSGN